MIKDPASLPKVTIYSDGACLGNPGPGGWAAIIQFGEKEKVLQGGEGQTTNNRMELSAALNALQALNKPCQVTFYTDSEYLRRGITEWMPGWKKRNWTRRGGELANVDLWQALDAVTAKHNITWYWLRGHAGHPQNERADRLARAAVPHR